MPTVENKEASKNRPKVLLAEAFDLSHAPPNAIGFIVKPSTGRILAVSESLVRDLSYDEGDLETISIAAQFIHSEDQELFSNEVLGRALKEKSNGHNGCDIRLRGNSLFEENYFLYRIYEVSELKHGNLRILAYDVNREKVLKEWEEQAKDRLRLIQEGINHDTRSPMSVAIAAVVLAGERLKEAYSTKNISEEFYQNVTRDLVDAEAYMSKVLRVMGSYLGQASEFSVEKKVKDVGLMLRLEEPIWIRNGKNQNNVKVEVEDSCKESIFVLADERLRQVFDNLVVNAIKYRDDGKKRRFVRISCLGTHDPQAYGLAAKGQLLVFSVADNGRGMPKEFLPRLFQQGTRAHLDISEGSGFGLYSVKLYLQTIGGDISVQTKKDVGTTFYVGIPVAEESN